MKKRCLNRRAYFFLIDSLIALGVLAVGAFLIFTIYIKTPAEEAPTIFSDDLMSFFAKNKIKNIDNAEVGLGGTYWSDTEVIACNGQAYVPNGEHTVLQQVAVFYEISQTESCYIDLAKNFIAKLIENILPSEYGFEFWMEDQLLYPDIEQTASKDATKVLIPSKKIVYGILDKETGTMFGPYEVEVLAWQKGN